MLPPAGSSWQWQAGREDASQSSAIDVRGTCHQHVTECHVYMLSGDVGKFRPLKTLTASVGRSWIFSCLLRLSQFRFCYTESFSKSADSVGSYIIECYWRTVPVQKKRTLEGCMCAFLLCLLKMSKFLNGATTQAGKTSYYKSHYDLNQDTRVERMTAAMHLLACSNVGFYVLYLECYEGVLLFFWRASENPSHQGRLLDLEKKGCNDSLNTIHNFIFFLKKNET